MSKCPNCQKDIGMVALVDLVFTWEPVKDELVETGWHKPCYLSAQQKMHPTGGMLRQKGASKRKTKTAKSVGSPTGG